MITNCAVRPPFHELAFPLIKELTGTAISLTRDASAAEDLVQETMLKAFRAYDRFAPGTNFRAWMQRILHNTFISDFRRRRDRHEQPLPETVDAEQPTIAPALSSSDLDAISERLDDSLKRALGRMKPEFREVFVRSALDDSTNEEIAEELKLPVGTVMSRMHRAREFLRHELGQN